MVFGFFFTRLERTRKRVFGRSEIPKPMDHRPGQAWCDASHPPGLNEIMIKLSSVDLPIEGEGKGKRKGLQKNAEERVQPLFSGKKLKTQELQGIAPLI